MNLKSFYMAFLKQTSIKVIVILYVGFLALALVIFKWPITLSLPYAIVVASTILLLNTFNLALNAKNKSKKLEGEQVYILNKKGSVFLNQYFFITVEGKKIKQYDLMLRELKQTDKLTIEKLQEDSLSLNDKAYFTIKIK